MKILGRLTAFGLCVLASSWVAGCGGGGGGGTTTTPPPSKTTPTVAVTPTAGTITTVQSTTVTVAVSGSSGTPTGSVTLSNGTYTSAATTLASGSATISVPAGTLAAGTDMLTASYTPDTASSANYNSSSGTGQIVVTKVTPAVAVMPGSASITTTQSLSVTVTVSGPSGGPTPTGSVIVSSGVFTSAATTLASGSATILVPAGILAVGSPTLIATYSPDTAGSAIYNGAVGMNAVTVNLTTPTVTVSPGSQSITTIQSLPVTVTVSGPAGVTTPTGSVTLTSGTTYKSAATPLVSGVVSITIPANSLATGSPTSLTANYTPDANSSSIYASTAGTGSVTVTSPTPYTLTVNSVAPSSGITIAASPADNNSKTGGTTGFTLTYYGGTQVTLSAPLSSSTYSFVSWTGCTTASSVTCNVTLNANTTVTATYNQVNITSITVTPNSATIGKQQQFTATVNGTGSYSSAVTWSLTPATGAGDISTTGLYNTPYPAPATVTVTATSTMTGFTNVFGTATVTLNAPATASGPALSVDVNTPAESSENPHTIDPYVYGMNGYLLDSASEKIANPGIIRWGGDATSRYNYQNNMTNSASDYYFESFLGEGGMFPNAGSSSTFTQFFQGADTAGSAALGTVPVNGWVTNTPQYACSFTQAQFPTQQEFENGCGNGVLTSGTDLNGSNGTSPTQIPDITSISESAPTPPTASGATSSWAMGTWAGGWVNSILTNGSYGNGASGKGVAVWDLDNEPTWWDAVHRDVHPLPFTYNEVTNGDIGTALAIKIVDPTALVSGPVMDNWWAYFYSKEDIEDGYTKGPCYQPWSNPLDREAHSGTPMLEYILQQMAAAQTTYGMRLLDYLDVHSYFEPDYNGNSVGFTTAGDTQEQQARMNGTRVFWDPTYTDPNYPQPNYITDSNYTSSCTVPLQAPQVIPMLQSWVAKDYPGTMTAIDEYNFGGLESINGAVTEADILGIFGRQGLNLGGFWPTTNYNTQEPGNYAFAMYRNYDGNNSTFGNTYLYATSMASGADAESQLAVYGAQRTSDSAITIMVINKTFGSLTSTVSLENFSAPSGTTAKVYQYSNANLTAITPQTPVSVTPPASGTTSTISYTFPAQSITLFVVPD